MSFLQEVIIKAPLDLPGDVNYRSGDIDRCYSAHRGETVTILAMGKDDLWVNKEQSIKFSRRIKCRRINMQLAICHDGQSQRESGASLPGWTPSNNRNGKNSCTIGASEPLWSLTHYHHLVIHQLTTIIPSITNSLLYLLIYLGKYL